MKLKLLKKTKFDLFYADYLTLAYEARKDILQALDECNPGCTVSELIEILFYEVYCTESDGIWRELFVELDLFKAELMSD